MNFENNNKSLKLKEHPGPGFEQESKVKEKHPDPGFEQESKVF